MFACHVYFNPPLPDFIELPTPALINVDGPVTLLPVMVLGREMIRVYGPVDGSGGIEHVEHMAQEIVNEVLSAGVDRTSISDLSFIGLIETDTHTVCSASGAGQSAPAEPASGAGQSAPAEPASATGAGQSAPAETVPRYPWPEEVAAVAEKMVREPRPMPTMAEFAAVAEKMRAVVGDEMAGPAPRGGTAIRRARSAVRWRDMIHRPDGADVERSLSPGFSRTPRDPKVDDSDWDASDIQKKINRWEDWAGKPTPRASAAAGAGQSAPQDAGAAAPASGSLSQIYSEVIRHGRATMESLLRTSYGQEGVDHFWSEAPHPTAHEAAGYRPIGPPPEEQQLQDRLQACLTLAIPAGAGESAPLESESGADVSALERPLFCVVREQCHRRRFAIDVSTWYLRCRAQIDGRIYIAYQAQTSSKPPPNLIRTSAKPPYLLQTSSKPPQNLIKTY